MIVSRLSTHLVKLALGGLVLLSLLYTLSSVQAATNPQINYQGKLTNSTGVAVPDGTYNMRFWLLTSPSIATTSAVWTESLTTTNRVQVTNGLFSVMLGSTTPLTGVDFNQVLYLGVEIGSTTTSPVWDGEMSPRKIIGSVPAAFEASRLGGVASSSFLRSDEADTMQATSSNTLLTLVQNGAGAVARFFSGVTEVFTILGNGNVGVGTSTPSHQFTVAGNARITGALFDSTNASGTSGMILTTTGSGTQWSATSSLGLGTSSVGVLNDLLDTTITSPATGNILSYNGSQWVNAATSSLGLSSAFTTSAQLAELLSDETGTGASVFGTGATLSSTTLSGTTFASGSFGIGTTTPSSVLDVWGSFRAGTSSTPTFIVNSLTNNVGVRTTNPTEVLEVVGNTLVRDTANSKSYRFRTTGTQLDFEGSNGDMFYSVWADAQFAGTQRFYMRLQDDVHQVDARGTWWWAPDNNLESAATPSLYIDGSSGSIGMGTNSPSQRLTVAGNARITGALFDSSNASGTSGMVLQSTGSGTQWVATSSLGIGGGASTFLALTDTPSSYTANRLFFTNSAGNAVTDSADLTFANSRLGTPLLNLAGLPSSTSTLVLFNNEPFIKASSTSRNTALGLRALNTATSSGNYNTALGYGTLELLTTGQQNIAVGDQALGSLLTGSFNVGVGAFALGSDYNGTSTRNVAVGNQALFDGGTQAAATDAVAIGHNAGYGDNNSTWELNRFRDVAIGSLAFGGGQYSADVISQDNVAIGYAAGYRSRSVGGNVLLGAYSGYGLTTGSNNIFIGASSSDALTTGSNNIAIGYNIDLASSTGSNQLSIGNLLFALRFPLATLVSARRLQQLN
jgi:hypothetical protein